MAWIKQGALGMLVAVILFAAAPLVACVPGFGQQTTPDCCVAMMQDCGGPTMSGSCCELAPTHNTVALVSAFAPEHGQQPAVLVRGAYLPVIADPGHARQTFGETDPTDPSPGNFSVLRI
jgi:hypothetical protein